MPDELNEDQREYVDLLHVLDTKRKGGFASTTEAELLELLDRVWWRMTAFQRADVDRYLDSLHSEPRHRRVVKKVT